MFVKYKARELTETFLSNRTPVLIRFVALRMQLEIFKLERKVITLIPGYLFDTLEENVNEVERALALIYQNYPGLISLTSVFDNLSDKILVPVTTEK